ncbi:MAG: electron transport complex subunit RsxB [Pseudomonadota bacterium]
MSGLPALQARLNAALPQTQCTRCGYPDCAAYAQAIADNAAPINQCPPGGAEGVARLAALTGQPVLPLNPANGSEGPRQLAIIDEDWCIGCTLCLDACPTDAILGGNKRMHTVIEVYCTGCELCIPVCPVDCIALENASGSATGWQAWSASQADQALARYKLHSKRVSIGAGSVPKTSEIQALEVPQADEQAQRKRAVIDAAVARARQRKP